MRTTGKPLHIEKMQVYEASYGYRPGEVGTGCCGSDARALLEIRLGFGV
jgi:hypothetical protein